MCDNPESGNVMQGTGGIRKMRFALKGRGKRGSARVIYIDFASYEKIYLLDVYTKNEKTDLTPDNKEKLRKVVKILEDDLRRKR